LENDDGKVIYLAKPEIAILTPIIKDRTEGYVFRPSDAISEKHTKKWEQAKRKKKTPSRLKRDAARAKAPKVRCNECYSAVSYRKAIERACMKAKVPHWFPYGLRHTGITIVGLECGIEAAQHVAGHKDLRTTLGYFHGEDAIAKGVALKRNERYKATVDTDAPTTLTEQETKIAR
jgi:integrase